jgi:hypothetical protein
MHSVCTSLRILCVLIQPAQGLVNGQCHERVHKLGLQSRPKISCAEPMLINIFETGALVIPMFSFVYQILF